MNGKPVTTRDKKYYDMLVVRSHETGRNMSKKNYISKDFVLCKGFFVCSLLFDFFVGASSSYIIIVPWSKEVSLLLIRWWCCRRWCVQKEKNLRTHTTNKKGVVAFTAYLFSVARTEIVLFSYFFSDATRD